VPSWWQSGRVTTRREPAGGAVRDVLARIPLFSELAPHQVDLVAAATRQVRLARGEVLFQAGDACRAFHCVVSGQVKLTLSTADGAEKVLEIIAAGETFGEAVMFVGRPYPVTAAGLLPTVLLTVPAAVVLDLVTTDPMFARRMLAGLAVRLHAMINDVESLSLRTGTQRVAGLLLGLAGDRPRPGVEVVLPAGKAVLASRLNLTPETFSRTLRDLSTAEVITVQGRGITLCDIRGLAVAAGAMEEWEDLVPGEGSDRL
jgi:CRP-like cAMP-binding protein